MVVGGASNIADLMEPRADDFDHELKMGGTILMSSLPGSNAPQLTAIHLVYWR